MFGCKVIHLYNQSSLVLWCLEYFTSSLKSAEAFLTVLMLEALNLVLELVYVSIGMTSYRCVYVCVCWLPER